MSPRQRRRGNRYENVCVKIPPNETGQKKAPNGEGEAKFNESETNMQNGSRQQNKNNTNEISFSNSKRPNLTAANKGVHRVLTEAELATFRTSFCDSHQTGQCPNSDSCDKSHCLTWQRRNPYRIHYCPQLCPEIQFVKSSKKMVLFRRCTRGKHCAFAHSKEEELYHPLVYKTKRCSAFPRCTRYYCPFIHFPEEARSGKCAEHMELMRIELETKGELDSFSEETQQQGSNEANNFTEDLQAEGSSYLSSFAEALSTVHVDPDNTGIMDSTFRDTTFDGNMDFSQPMSYADLVRSGGQTNSCNRDGMSRVGYIACPQENLNFVVSQDPCLPIDSAIDYAPGLLNSENNILLNYNDLPQQEMGYAQTSSGGEAFSEMLVNFMSEASDQEEMERIDTNVMGKNDPQIKSKWMRLNDEDYFNSKFDQVLSLNGENWTCEGSIF
ncbi:hypothetical protein BMR1_01G00980 [Babesia microti strain RI]|uniref:C3H1-type domain-containing protein n=1 Tax=Babesia microti (strain RI) TaxID=1133968 RepID=I7J850_BABMR|nr:hypothetical protein BMR1_01G00980 [Babesia microti strain RI]CCF72659.1 hypothetical protein BMR1_01G00980 [Babesia microti strain RI]|eukprot:XP_012647268.1 hypothetical protein BMR1_01G00980 [Babesia microti strain RI]